MEACMIECSKKLALWCTITFKPIMTHEELEPIMATLGFMAQSETPCVNGVVWKEYTHPGGGCQNLSLLSPPPKAKLPSHLINGRHRIDGLHVYTYRAFVKGVKFYLGMDDISNIFHVRGMPLQPMSDRNKKFRRMEEDESVFIYKEGTLDQSAYILYQLDKNNVNSSSNDEHKSIHIRDKGSNITIGNVIPLKDIIGFKGLAQ